MEKRATQVLESQVEAFKDGLKEKIEELAIEEISKKKLIEYINAYKTTIGDADFLKRKRTQVLVPTFLRCISKLSDGTQCSRKKQDGSDYCGTHSKGSPHGTYMQENVTLTKVDVWAQEIGGIIYYVDSGYNVYKTEDIINGKQNPAIIAKYEKCGDKYSISQFGL